MDSNVKGAAKQILGIASAGQSWILGKLRGINDEDDCSKWTSSSELFCCTRRSTGTSAWDAGTRYTSTTYFLFEYAISSVCMQVEI